MIDSDFRKQVIALRKLKFTVNDIANHLNMYKSSEREAISQICQEKEFRRYQRGIDFPAPAYRSAGSNG